jgi:hypothetical protein
MNKLTDLLKREVVEQLEKGEHVEFSIGEDISGWIFMEDGEVGISILTNGEDLTHNKFSS